MVAAPQKTLGDFTEYLVDDSIGIIRYVKELPVEAGSPNFFHFYARACDTRAFCKQRNSADAGGASTKRESALAKAIGEALERYCGALYHAEDFPLASFDSASFPCVSPHEFALYTPAQIGQKNFPFVSFEKTTKLRWVPAKDLMSGGVCYVPASKVFVPYRYARAQGELPISQPISTGLACHMGVLQAAVSAICEVIERDAFTINWQGRLGPPKIQIETVSDANRALVYRFERMGIKIILLLLSMDHGVPVILSSLKCQNQDDPALVFALACALDPEEAVRKSLEELAHSYRFCRLLKQSRPAFVPTRSFSNVLDRDSHVALYCDPSNSHLADFIFSSKKHVAFSEIENLSTGEVKKDLLVLRESLNRINHRILLIDLTTDDLRDFGISVVRAVIPGFHPLCIGHHIRALGGSRLCDVPQKLGYRKLKGALSDNPAPHPLP